MKTECLDGILVATLWAAHLNILVEHLTSQVGITTGTLTLHRWQLLHVARVRLIATLWAS